MMVEETVRWGLLSTARINERLIPAIRECERSELVAVASRTEASARRYATEWNIQRAYGSYEQMLADPAIDAVYVSLPNSLHAQWSVRCAEAGKHVLCEKPMALTPVDVDRMTDAAKQNGVVLQEACMMRYHSQTHKVRDMIARGAIGDVRAMRGVFTFNLTREGDVRFDPHLGGGVLWDLGSYEVSFMQAMMQENPVEVQGMQVSGESGVDLTFAGQMRFAGGVLGQFYCSFQSTRRAEADLIGTEGVIHLDLPWVNHIGVSASVRVTRGEGAQSAANFGNDPRKGETERMVFENVNGYRDEVDSMVASILDDAEPVLTPADSRGNVATVAALYQSAREGRPVGL